MNPLQLRLAALRRRLWLVVTFRGVAWVGAILLLAAAIAGLLDWRIHLPSLVRALLLTGTLSAAGYVIYRDLFRPLWARTDDLSLALRVEARYPALNDALASAVQFLEQPSSSEHAESASLRREAVKRALGRARGFDFQRVVDARGVRAAGLSLLTAGGLALALVLLSPQLAWTAFLRLTHPFGGHDWPRKTQLTVKAPQRVARGTAFEIQAAVAGVIPERATVEYRFEGAPPLEQVYEVTRETPTTGNLAARLKPDQVQRSFRFQVRANDALSSWQEVEVLPPPQLAALDGRPSPQIHLHFPSYTDLADQQLPDGAASIDAAAGTEIRLRAAVDRSVVRAWLEYPAELEPVLSVAAFLAPLGVPQPTGALELAAAQQASWKRIPAQLDAEGRVLTADFIARVSGTLALYFEDEMGLGNTRLLELRTLVDPAPVVQLLRPSRSQDSFELLPDADLTLQVQAEDLQYALRSVYLEYRLKREDAPDLAGEPGQLNLYDHEALGNLVPWLFAGLDPAPFKVPTEPPRLRWQRLEAGRRWSLKELQLREGDILAIQACADDFDDVTVNKQPGRSNEIELRIVNRTALDLSLNEAQAKIQQEVVRLHKQQQDALQKVIPAETFARNNKGQLEPKHIDDLLQAEQIQQQIRARIGTRQEGLRADVARVQQALRDNHLPRSGIQDLMDALANELDRLDREELRQIEPRLTEARKESEAGPEKQTVDPKSKPPLTEARKHQEEVEKTLAGLLKLLEPWSSTREFQGEAKSILQEQRKLAGETSTLNQATLGKKDQDLTPAEKSELQKTAELQGRLAERTQQLLNKLDNLANDSQRKEQDPDLAKALAEAAKRGNDKNATGNMQQAADSIRDNKLTQAGAQQRAAAQAMEDVAKALEDRREEELDRLIKRMKEAEQKLDELAERQDELRRKAAKAAQEGDAQKRAEELKRLAREQEQLEKETQEMVRELSRLRAEQASQALSQAGGRMQQAGQQMDQGEKSAEQQEEALDRLNEAQQELQKAREQAEEELAREKLAKIADQIKGLRDRQEALQQESGRLYRSALENKKWTRELRVSLKGLADNQQGLGKETERIAKEKLEGAKIFTHLVGKSAEGMQQAATHIRDRWEEANKALDILPEGQDPVLNLVAEQAADAETQKLQRTALRRLDQLLEALKPEAGQALRMGKKQGGNGSGGGGGGGNQKSGGPSDSIPPLAELKALRALQQEVAERTKEFAKQHPDVAKLTDKEKDELQELQQDQQEVRTLFQQALEGAEPEGDKK
jgi:hypothetical protein